MTPNDDPDVMENELRARMEETRDPEALADYALFLQSVRKDHDAAEALYQEAVEADPDNPALLRLYAEFLAKIRQDALGAEVRFHRALELAPHDPEVLGSYAFFLKRHERDPALADDLYKKALKANPDDPALLAEYASFLKTFQGDNEGADTAFRQALDALAGRTEKEDNQYTSLLDIGTAREDATESLYRKALERNPDNVTVHHRYAAWLLANGRRDEALPHLDDAISMCGEDAELLCLLFYLYAHFDCQTEQPESLLHMQRLLLAGTRVADFRPDANVRQAIAEGHPQPELLEALPSVIRDEQAPDALARFAAWPQTGSG